MLTYILILGICGLLAFHLGEKRNNHVSDEYKYVIGKISRKNIERIEKGVSRKSINEIVKSNKAYWDMYDKTSYGKALWCFWVYPARKMFPRELLDYIDEK
jgi:hypothetical protein